MNGHIVDFKRYIIGNKFINDKFRAEIFQKVDTVVRKAFLSYKYGKLWLVNFIKRKDAVNEFDLELNEIGENKKDLITYIDIRARRKYVFTQKDFRKLIQRHLENSYMYDHMPQPLSLKNPYTNKEFNTLDLIDIDEMLIDSPLIWKIYRNCKYNLEKFKIINYTYLTTCCASSYVDQLEQADIQFYIEDIFMFYNFINYCKRCVNEINQVRNNQLRNILINWFLYQKRLTMFTQTDLNKLCEMFKFNCKKHINKDEEQIKKDNKYIIFDGNLIDFQFTGGPIKEHFVFIGKKDDERLQNTTNKTTNKIKIKMKIKKANKFKNVLKKKAVIKTII